MVSMYATSGKGMKGPTRGYHNCIMNHILIFDRFVKVERFLHDIETQMESKTKSTIKDPYPTYFQRHKILVLM